jgi:hypothetical protein
MSQAAMKNSCLNSDRSQSDNAVGCTGQGKRWRKKTD